MNVLGILLILLGVGVIAAAIGSASKKRKRKKELPAASTAPRIMPSAAPKTMPEGKPVNGILLYEYKLQIQKRQCPGCQCENELGTGVCEVCGVPLR